MMDLTFYFDLYLFSNMLSNIYPKEMSRMSIMIKPTISIMVGNELVFSFCDSGIISCAITNTIAPAAKPIAYGSNVVNVDTQIAPRIVRGISTPPDKNP